MQLSVIIPTLNEQDNLPALLHELSGQSDISFEVVVADGGSTDDTRKHVEEFAKESGIPFIWIASSAGRAVQLNAGSSAATADELLFLHADTRLGRSELSPADSSSFLARFLADSMAHMRSQREAQATRRIAGHFGLSFADTRGGGYYFYEAKSRLNRPGSVNGEQGMWLSRDYFFELGGFDESLPIMEDARLALKVGQTGRWVNLPGILTTSARRFKTEGLASRQVLNSFLRCFDVIGFHHFFYRARTAYCQQGENQQLDLRPFLRLSHEMALRSGWLGYMGWWYKTGSYVRGNAWQLAFALECGINRRRGFKPGVREPKLTQRFERVFNFLTDNPVGNALAGGLTHAVFHGLWAVLQLRHRSKARAETGAGKKVTAPATKGHAHIITGLNKLLEVPFTDDTYLTPKGRSHSLFGKLCPTLYFYARGGMGTVRRASKMARRGVYYGDAWTQSSLEVVDAMEAVGGTFEITGLENIDSLTAPVVFVGNHMSTLETFVLPAIIQPKRPVTFVVKESLMNYFWFGNVIGARDPIVVGRTNPREDLMAVMGKGKKLLSQGTSVIIFPQTTRADEFDTTKFNTIGAKLAARAGVAVVPVALQTKAWGNGKWLKDFGTIRPHIPTRIAFGEPIPPEGKGDEAHLKTIKFIGGKMEEWRKR